MDRAQHNNCLRDQALAALMARDWQDKLNAVAAIDDRARVDVDLELAAPAELPGRPAQPKLVPPAQVPRRSVQTQQGRAALVHALAHIEFNAINLALDAIWRYCAMPIQFYTDWLKVAREEAYHFELLNRHLHHLDSFYGAFPAHDGLWEMAHKTQDDLLARLALVPRTLEARGLDASPLIRDKLAQAGDAEAAAILDIILRDEIGHVAIGNYWYRHVCRLRNLDPLTTYVELAQRHGAPRLRGPFNIDARRAAGFEQAELEVLCSGA